MVQQVWQYVRSRWKRGLFWGLLIATIFFVLSFRIGTLFPGATANEISYFNEVSSGKAVLKDPEYLPHKAISYLVTKATFSISGIRLVSVIFGIGFMIGAWYLLSFVFSRRTVVMGGILLLCSSWVLIITRSAVPDSSYLLAVGAAAATYWVLNTIDSWSVVPIVLLLTVPFVYVPGIVYISLVISVLYRQQITAAFKALSGKQRTVTAAVFTVVSLPLLIGIYFKPSLVMHLFGLPMDIQSYQAVPVALLEQLQSLVYISQTHNPFTLVSLPYLDVFTVVFLLFGIYRLRFWNSRWRLLSGIGGAFSLLIVSLGIVPLSALLPLIYAMVIYGVSFLLAQWYVVFPKNPIARGAGASMLLIAVLLIGYYHVVKFYIAWPHTPQTDENYNQYLIK